MKAPTITVMLCVRNGERYLAEALDSVVAQEHPILETIVIDGASSDGSARIAARHPVGARLVKEPILGHGPALNRGVAEAAGDFIAIIDADDVWPKHRLARLADALSRVPEAGVVHGAIVNCDRRLTPVSAPLSARMITAALVRRSELERVGAFRTDISHGVNVDWISRAAASGVVFHGIPDTVVLRRIHDSNMGVTGHAKSRSDMLRIIRDHHARNRK